MPKVSVVMGTWNGEKNIDEAIASICNQSFTDWELLVCDDCSSDRTYQKLLVWSEKSSQIKVIKNDKNLHLAATLNRCLKIAEGEYIARMDDDDVSYRDRFQKQVEFLDTHKEYGFVAGQVDCYDGKAIVKNRLYRKAEPEKKDFLKGTQFIHPVTMFRKECLDKACGYREKWETLRTEDYDLFMRLYALGYKGYNIQEPLLRYLINPSAMQTKRRYRYRINEMRVRWYGFSQLNLMPRGILYAIRPLLVGLIPHKIIWKLLYEKKGKANGRSSHTKL